MAYLLCLGQRACVRSCVVFYCVNGSPASEAEEYVAAPGKWREHRSLWSVNVLSKSSVRQPECGDGGFRDGT